MNDRETSESCPFAKGGTPPTEWPEPIHNAMESLRVGWDRNMPNADTIYFTLRQVHAEGEIRRMSLEHVRQALAAIVRDKYPPAEWDASTTTCRVTEAHQARVEVKEPRRGGLSIEPQRSEQAAIDKPLTPRARAVLALLKSLGPNEALTTKQILDALGGLETPIYLDDSTFYSRIIPELKPHGVQNRPKVGYYLSSDAQGTRKV